MVAHHGRLRYCVEAADPLPGEVVIVVIGGVVLCIYGCDDAVGAIGEGISKGAEAIGNLFFSDGGGRYGGDPRTAQEIISQEKKGSVNREFPGEWRDNTYDEIQKAAAAGSASAKEGKKATRQARVW